MGKFGNMREPKAKGKPKNQNFKNAVKLVSILQRATPNPKQVYPMESHNKCRVNNGFTLVELSIVMIIIGLLIGGIFGGMKLVDNANVQRTVQDLKSIESAAVTFKDTYRALPGDIKNPSAKLPNCTDTPCATGGDGDRKIENIGATWHDAITSTEEVYTFWHHLQAANMVTLDNHNTTDMTIGEGTPSAAVDGGYRMVQYTGSGWPCAQPFSGSEITIINSGDAAFSSSISLVNCSLLSSVDKKMDDGVQYGGKFISHYCASAYTCTTSYDYINNKGYAFYDAQGF